MATVFWDWEGILLIEYLSQGCTVTSALYLDTILYLHNGIKDKRGGKLSKKTLLFHDSVHPYTADLSNDCNAGCTLFAFRECFSRNTPPNISDVDIPFFLISIYIILITYIDIIDIVSI